MLYDNDVELVEKAVCKGFRDQDSSNAWERIKKVLESVKQSAPPTNKQSIQFATVDDNIHCPCCDKWLNLTVSLTPSP